MKINPELISHLEHLARLELSATEKAQMEVDLNRILTMVEQLQGLSTTGVEPLIYLNPEAQVWREDSIKGQVDRTAALAVAPSQDGSFFRVPKVIDLSS